MKKQIKVAYFPSTTNKDIVLGSNGKSLDNYCIKCTTEEDLRSGNYILDSTFVITDDVVDILQEESILKVATDYGDEVFRISKVTVGTRYIDIVARQITIADSLTLWLEDVRPTNQSGSASASYLLNNSIGNKEIQIVSDITKLTTAYYMRMSLYKALHAADQSFLNRWGGEVQRRGYTEYINKHIGVNRGVSIREGKNLTGFNGSTNIDGLVTKARGQGFDGILGNYIESPVINAYRSIYTNVIKYDDVKVKDENNEEGYDTLAQAQAELDRRVKEEFSINSIDKIKASYNINFVELEKTEEYKNYISAERVYIGDTIRVYVPKIEIDINVRAIYKTYDVLAQKTIEIKLSNYIESTPLTIKQLADKLDTIDSTDTILQQAKDNATLMIKSGLKNSYVVVRENEIIIGDTKDINTMVNVWRFNKNGLGHSGTGYYGEFGTAITADGQIVADFITTGILSANVIRTGILKSFNGKTWINMESGTFNFADKISYDGDKFTIQMRDKTLDEFKDEYDSAKLQTSKDIADVQNSTNTLKDSLGGYTADGILDKSEKQSIEILLKTLRTEKADIDAKYKAVYWNPDLLGAGATQLKDTYDYYISKYNNLITAINALLSSEKVTQTDRNNTDLAFVEHDTVLGDYSKSVNNAIDAIAEKKKQDIKKYADAKFEVMDDKIVGKVSKGDFGTYMEQNPYAVKIAWNKVSNYVQFENGGLSIYDGALTTNKKRATFDESGNHFWRDGYYLGKIGTNQYKYDSSIKGIVFNLTVDGGYMSWSSKETSTSDAYTMVWTYANKVTGSYGANMLHAGVDIDMHYNTLRNVKFEGGGRSGTLNCVQIKQVNSDGTIQQWSNGLKMVFQNGILVDAAWSNS